MSILIIFLIIIWLKKNNKLIIYMVEFIIITKISNDIFSLLINYHKIELIV